MEQISPYTEQPSESPSYLIKYLENCKNKNFDKDEILDIFDDVNYPYKINKTKSSQELCDDLQDYFEDRPEYLSKQYIEMIPPEIQYQIMKRLPITDIKRIAPTSRQFLETTNIVEYKFTYQLIELTILVLKGLKCVKTYVKSNFAPNYVQCIIHYITDTFSVGINIGNAPSYKYGILIETNSGFKYFPEQLSSYLSSNIKPEQFVFPLESSHYIFAYFNLQNVIDIFNFLFEEFPLSVYKIEISFRALTQGRVETKPDKLNPQVDNIYKHIKNLFENLISSYNFEGIQLTDKSSPRFGITYSLNLFLNISYLKEMEKQYINNPNFKNIFEQIKLTFKNFCQKLQ
jgi:hypothetical protein